MQIAVAPVASGQTPFGGTAWAIPGTVEAEDYDVGGEGGVYYVCMEYVDGGSLSDLLRREQTLDIPFAVSIAGGVLLSTVVSFYFPPPMFALVRKRNAAPMRSVSEPTEVISLRYAAE